MPPPTLVLGGAMTGAGKTTLSVGILSALRRRGLKVQGFKAGPDFIDPGFHARAAGRPARNLDTWMMPEEALLGSFASAARDADFALVEGVMGLFDGRSGEGEEGSTAHLAKILRAPVVLVADASGMARSAAAMVLGYQRFDPDLRLAGVIFNRVGSPTHARYLEEAVEDLNRRHPPGLRLLGCLPREEGLELPERHLGLVTAGERGLTDEYLERLSRFIEERLDLDSLLAIAREADPPAPPLPWGAAAVSGLRARAARPRAARPVRIALARDEAFCFYYEDNLDVLREAGAELVFFSPLRDSGLPEGTRGVILGGGYPEVHAEALEKNGRMREAIRAFAAPGGPIYAECGGLMYLTEAIADLEGRSFEMVGLLPTRARMLPRRKALGYVEVTLRADCLLGPRGAVARGHEFHFSEVEEPPPSVERLYRVSKGKTTLAPGDAERLEGFRVGNVLASYCHLHFLSNPLLAEALVEGCRGGGG